MNPTSNIGPDGALLADVFDDACGQINMWRGRCIDAFSRAEAEVTETLLSLSQVPERGINVKLPHLLGQRLDALASVIGDDGEFHKEGRRAIKALSDFRAHEPLRTILCHGVAKILVDRTGKWTLVLRLLALRSKKSVREELMMEKERAESDLAALRSASRKLCDHLKNLRSEFKSK